MKRQHALVTTFHQKGYENYGRKMIATFVKYWPKDITLYVYWEKEKPKEQYANIVYIDLLESCPDLTRFLERNKNNPKDNSFHVVQYYEQGAEMADPRHAGMRCSFKSYCMFHAAEHINADWIHWVDADTFSIKKVPDDFLKKVAPQDALLSFLGRDERDTETGWWGLNLKHPEKDAFIAAFKNRYDNDLVYTEQPYSYDCTTFDIVRNQFEGRGVKTFNIAKRHGVSYHSNPFLHSILGKYMRHALGPSRKESQDGTIARDWDTFVHPRVYQLKQIIKRIIGTR